MNISSITSGSLPGLTARPASAETQGVEARQNSSAITAQNTQSTQTAQPVTPTQKTEVSRKELEDAVKATNEFVNPINNSITFSLDDDTGVTVVKVIDVATKEVIRQFPSEEMLSISKAIDKVKGLLVQQKA